MDTALILVRQILQMFVLAGLGYWLFRIGKITLEGSRTLGNILIYLSLPAVIISGFLKERTPENMLGLLWSGLGAAALLLLSILLSRLLFRRDPIAAFAGAFSNPGFFGIPLILASAGQGAVFYVACFVAFLNIGQWTYGVSLLNGQPLLQGLQPKKLIRAPFVLAILAGLLIFFTQPPFFFPEDGKANILTGCLSAVKELNTPLSMFTIGVYFAQVDLKAMLRRRTVYAVAAVRLLAVPLIAVPLLALVPETLHDMKLALLIAIACPVGANVAVYAQLHNKDYAYAVETVVVSTLLSVVSIPAVVALANLVW